MSIKTVKGINKLEVLGAIQGHAQFVAGAVNSLTVDEFNKITANWENKPTFTGRVTVTSERVVGIVEVTGPEKAVHIWHWLDKGTGEYAGGTKYRIPKGSGMVSFNSGYVPKTSPGGKYGGPGEANGPRVTRSYVMHPGVRPRKFVENVKQYVLEYLRTAKL